MQQRDDQYPLALWREEYNMQRPHLSLGGLSPREFRSQLTIQGWREVPLWVFINEAGNPIDADNFRSRVWPKLLSKADLRHFPIHSLRHTFASRLIQNGATLLYLLSGRGKLPKEEQSRPQHHMGSHEKVLVLPVLSQSEKLFT
jgi:integrase